VETDLNKALRRLSNLEAAWRVISANGRTSKSDEVKLELEKFAQDASRNLRSIQTRLVKKTFAFGLAKGVPVPKLDEHGNRTGKSRPIVLAPVESRVVQRATLNVLLTVEKLQPFVKTPFSFGGIRSERRRDETSREARSKALSAVPAAIDCVLKQIGAGGKYVASADIRSFFTQISKSHVESIVANAVEDPIFMAFFKSSIKVELFNLAELRANAADFPIEDIGVAQGNSLSPLLGNIVLSDFDRLMNEGDCRCIRYIDDFIIIAPTEKAANARLRRSIEILRGLGMELSPEKSSKGGMPVEAGFDFLGISIKPGIIRPAQKAQAKFLTSLDAVFLEGVKSMRGVANGATFDRTRSLLGTMRRVDGMIDGWGKHYWFCNDQPSMAAIDGKIATRIGKFLGEYRDIRELADPKLKTSILGISELAKQPREPFVYPKKTA